MLRDGPGKLRGVSARAAAGRGRAPASQSTGQNGGGEPTVGQEFYAAPVRVSDTLKLTTLAAGYAHACAIATDGDTYSWGDNEASGSTFVSISVGDTHACGADTAHDAQCWGNNWYGQLGVGSAGGCSVGVPGSRVRPDLWADLGR